jgi:hypothetical protein
MARAFCSSFYLFDVATTELLDIHDIILGHHDVTSDQECIILTSISMMTMMYKSKMIKF